MSNLCRRYLTVKRQMLKRTVKFNLINLHTSFDYLYSPIGIVDFVIHGYDDVISAVE